jgi:hypothetical protein
MYLETDIVLSLMPSGSPNTALLLPDTCQLADIADNDVNRTTENDPC